MYKPLPDCITIKTSPIHGLGLYSTEKIKQGTMLGMIHYPIGDWYLRSPLGGFGNHSDDPNCAKIWHSADKSWWIYSRRDIERDEEITWAYTLYEID
jgi:SET domain-containing protein